MKIVLYGEYQDTIDSQIGNANIVAWIPEEGTGQIQQRKISRIELDELKNEMCDFVLITGNNLDNKYINLLRHGIHSYKIRTIGDLCCERREVIEQTIYYNEMCMENLDNQENRKILMVAQDLAESGAPVALFQLACCLLKMGYRIRVYCQCDGPMRNLFLKQGIPVIVEDLNNRQNLINWLHWEKFEFVVVNTLLQYKLVHKLGLAEVKVLWWLHECENYYNTILEYEGKLPTMGKNIYVACVGKRVEDSFKHFYGSHPNVFELLYGIDDRCKNEMKEQQQKEKLVFAVIGAIQYRKSQDIFISAIRKLPKEDRKKCIFRIIGEAAFENNGLMQYVKEAAAEIEELEYDGALSYEAMQRMYDEIDVVVCPSRIDPMPVVVTEGFMFHKVCIISDRIGTAEYVTDGQEGFLCEVGDAEKLAEKMQFIINNQQKMKNITENGRKIYDKYFTLDVFYNSVKEIVLQMNERKEE